MSDIQFRTADPADATIVAVLHADSWRRHYRGAYADSFLDGDVVADRQAVWAARLSTPDRPARTVLAEYDGGLVGFIHVIFDADSQWGSLVDNLHVVHDRHRSGIGTALLTRAAEAVTGHAEHRAMYLWVLEQNVRARAFYRANGAAHVETALVPPPGGDPTRLNGAPQCHRMAWSDVAVRQLSRSTTDPA